LLDLLCLHSDPPCTMLLALVRPLRQHQLFLRALGLFLATGSGCGGVGGRLRSMAAATFSITGLGLSKQHLQNSGIVAGEMVAIVPLGRWGLGIKEWKHALFVACLGHHIFISNLGWECVTANASVCLCQAVGFGFPISYPRGPIQTTSFHLGWAIGQPPQIHLLKFNNY
jgi:hypothetical protein